ncbi:MAG: RNA pseudouridine synthase [Verrucomicrobiales bacterium]|nr:RNA pseudouridine synthase [Verrucomicrobiales bacterium]MEC7358022.1 RNA pseudouridine synthase [Verrucomicrobiota bacterium]
MIVNNTNFEVLCETEDFIVVNKPAPLLVHPSVPGNPPTLLDGLKDLLAYDIANGARLSIINRLDRETSGIVIVAKNKTTAREFGIAMQQRQITKEYLALVHGTPQEKKFTVEAPILRAGEVGKSKIWVKQIPHPDGKPSITKFELIEKLEPFSLLKAIPETGRMHQIRVHSLHVNLPIVGDKIYGINENCYLKFIENGWTKELESELILPRQALHCHRMSLEGIGKWEAPVPNSFKTCRAAS